MEILISNTKFIGTGGFRLEILGLEVNDDISIP